MSAHMDVKRALWQTFLESAKPTLDQWLTQLEQPQSTQERALLRLLEANSDCAFGRAHHFARLHDSTQFRDNVPIHDYAQLQPWIERAQNESEAILTSSPPLFFERTSGNSALQKAIPYTRAFLAEMHSALTVWLADMHRQVPGISHGSSYWSMSPPLQMPVAGPNGIRIGSASDLAYLHGSHLAGLAGTLLIPEFSGELSQWRRQTLLALLADADLSFISVWSPTFLTSLLQPLFDGETPEHVQTFAWLEAALPASRQSALRRARSQGVCTELWPRLAAVSCWMEGPSRHYFTQLAVRFPQTQWLPKSLFATEGVVSIPFGDGPGCPLAIGSHYLEFLCEDGALRHSHSLRLGETAQVLLTTGGGLYRYALGDRVRVVGMSGATPRVEFVGRATGTSDLVGEKLDEQTVQNLFDRCLATRGAACLIPNAYASPPHYTALVATSRHLDASALALTIETALSDAFHYCLARRLGQLGLVQVRLLDGGADQLAHVLQQAAELSGIRAGDFKPRSLINRLETAEALLALTESSCRHL
ncbi:GH3 family domain-containing protein [Pseudomonas nunensis]|uniref:GH3 auxin-responsive promoter family protein n=1 Tax=Pseudomonas nunensis TaxID=2961896 RepID=A0ABY5EEH0_9PSED|nr:GH3 auxin-responsive promoter family protein [Pseudomonas nunensis]KPN88512.1 auxin-responsive GH3-related protein [Pseudomonas nunensis]MCL5225829.1 GH3 auxin-responsive promoter family protein [Pseudomonas nunensis]UTO13817.1 GH3 auxin-responsive promoter family protein [Pseudomonas nunensis]